MNSFRRTPYIALACLACHMVWAENFQFAATGGAVSCTNGAEVVSWAGNGGAVLLPVHAGEGGWQTPQLAQCAVMFGADATPLAPPGAATSLVSRIFAVATATNLQGRSTLLFAGTSFWLENGTAGMAIAPALPSGQSITIDGVADGALAQGGRFLAEIALPAPVRACDVFFGGHAASPLWRRGWEGAIHEVVMLGADAAQQEAEAVRAFLANYWRTPEAPEPPPGAVQTLRRLGIKTHGFFGSKMILR